MSRHLSGILLFGLLPCSVTLEIKTAKQGPSEAPVANVTLLAKTGKQGPSEAPVMLQAEMAKEGPSEANFKVAESKKQPPTDRRTLLVCNILGFHGSTALQGLLMSSPQLATICKQNGWQCEASVLMWQLGFANRQHSWDWSQALAIMGQYWDLKKHYLLQKDPWLPGFQEQEMWNKTGRMTVEAAGAPSLIPSYVGSEQYYDDPHGAHLKIKQAAAKPLPQSFQKEGIKHLDVEYLMMWRPVCTSKLSSHFHQKFEDEDFELRKLEEQVEFHKTLVEDKTPVHLVNYADFIWETEKTGHRLEKELPYLGELDTDYIPKLGKDIYPGNQWKGKGTAKSFGEKHDPTSLGYSLKDKVCTEGTMGFVHLPASYAPRIEAATNYMRSFSK